MDNINVWYDGLYWHAGPFQIISENGKYGIFRYAHIANSERLAVEATFEEALLWCIANQD